MSQKLELKVGLNEIREAQAVLSQYLAPSPLLHNAWLSEAYGCELYFKMENMQPIGSFKIRGATYKIACLDESERKRGVIAASAGNHAQGVAWGSKKLGVKAMIVMPKSAPIVKIQNTRALGAEVVLEGDNYDEAYAAAIRISGETGAVYVHAFEDERVVAGQGTVALEILEQLPEVDAVFSSIGGGGLMAGIALVMKELKPSALLVGCQASGAPSMIESIRKGHAVKLERADTFADGIKVRDASEAIRRILAPRMDHMLQADDESIAAAVLAMMEKAKVIAEGAGALPLAVLDQLKAQLKGKKVVLVVGGGNIDVNVLSRIIDRGLIRAGRRLRVNVLISDLPGSLARLTALIAQMEANIIQAIHDRNEPSTQINQTEVELTLETKGHEHSKEVINALKQHVIRLVMVG